MHVLSVCGSCSRRHAIVKHGGLVFEWQVLTGVTEERMVCGADATTDDTLLPDYYTDALSDLLSIDDEN